jgi:hypothetical protein
MVRSRVGRLARNAVGGVALRLPPVAHKAAGTLSGIGIDYPHAPRAADVALRDGRRLYEALRDGTYVLVAPESAERHLRGRVLLAPPAQPSPSWTLVRPDAHVAWRGAPGDLAAALDRAGLTG